MYVSICSSKIKEFTVHGQVDMIVLEYCGYFLTNTLWIFSEGLFIKGQKICSKYVRPLLDP